MRTEQIQAGWRRALKAMRAAETLRSEDLLEDSVSRAYYAVLHAAKAALLVHDQQAKSHAGVRRLFGQVLIKSGEVQGEWGRILSREQDQREVAEYDVDLELEPEAVDELLTDARRFLERMAQYIESKGVALSEVTQD